jgi:hypothetical protein
LAPSMETKEKIGNEIGPQPKKLQFKKYINKEKDPEGQTVTGIDGIDGEMDGQTDGLIRGRWTDRQIRGRQMDGWIDRLLRDIWMDVRTDGRMNDGWMDGRTDGRTDGDG